MVRQELATELLWPVRLLGAPGTDQPVWMERHTQRHESRLLRTFEDMIRSFREEGGEQARRIN